MSPMDILLVKNPEGLHRKRWNSTTSVSFAGDDKDVLHILCAFVTYIKTLCYVMLCYVEVFLFGNNRLHYKMPS